MSEDAQNANPLMKEAALWFARMRGPEAEDRRAAFEAWLATSALHRSAYNRAAETFSMGKFLADEPPMAGDSSEFPEVVTGRSRLWQPALLVGACVLALLAWVMVASPTGRLFGTGDDMAIGADGRAQRAVELAADSGDVRTERLTDGSTVTMDPASRLAISYDDVRRIFRLERGHARFDVAHDPRPFVVFAGGGSVTARGTVFEVTVQDDAQVEVKLLRGTVDVAMPRAPASGGQVTRLRAGQSLTFETSAVALGNSTATTPNVVRNEALEGSGRAASGSDIREVDAVRVADLVAEANASGRLQIHLDDARYGERRISGRFRVADPARLSARLAALYDLDIDRSRPGVIILRPNSRR